MIAVGFGITVATLIGIIIIHVLRELRCDPFPMATGASAIRQAAAHVHVGIGRWVGRWVGPLGMA